MVGEAAQIFFAGGEGLGGGENKQGFLNSPLSIKSVFRRTGKQPLLPTESAAITKESGEREVTHVIKTVGLQAT